MEQYLKYGCKQAAHTLLLSQNDSLPWRFHTTMDCCAPERQHSKSFLPYMASVRYLITEVRIFSLSSPDSQGGDKADEVELKIHSQWFMYYIDGFSYDEPSSHSWDETYLIIVDDLSDVFLDSICQHFVEYFCIDVHEGY
ncbi:hypothetical protein H671_7g17425 [Cricetulus griseus]|nr:hypothetical protein H671_7g17425 [Cricetulus griseus]